MHTTDANRNRRKNRGGNEMNNNEKRAEKVLKRFEFDFKQEYRDEIRELLIEEINNYQEGSSEYLRMLCGYLFCIGNSDDLELIKKAKYEINFDAGCMIDEIWIESMESNLNGDIENRKELIQDYIEYYKNYFDNK